MQAFLTDILQLTEVPIRLSGLFLVESENQRHYNYYRSKMSNKNNGLREQFGEARAIHLAMQHGAITYEQAELLVTPILLKLNSAIGLIAKEHRVKPKFIRFQDLGRSL